MQLIKNTQNISKNTQDISKHNESLAVSENGVYGYPFILRPVIVLKFLLEKGEIK